MSITLNQSIHGKYSYIQYFSKIILCYVAGEQHVSDCAHILGLVSMGQHDHTTMLNSYI